MLCNVKSRAGSRRSKMPSVIGQAENIIQHLGSRVAATVVLLLNGIPGRFSVIGPREKHRPAQ